MTYQVADRPHVEPASFSTLPYELRRQIWMLTIQPRLLCLHAHQHATPLCSDGKGPGGHPYRRITVTFTLTAAEGPPSRVFEECDNHKTESAVDIDLDVDDFGKATEEHLECGRLPLFRSTPGPVALHVCAESRQIALERYQLAFPLSWMDVGVEYLSQYWNITNYGTTRWGSKTFNKISTEEKGTWIDFQRDTVVIDRGWRRNSPDLRHFMKNPLDVLAAFAEKDARKIVKLAIRSNAGDSGLGPGFHYYAKHITSRLAFSSVTELILDDKLVSSWPTIH